MTPEKLSQIDEKLARFHATPGGPTDCARALREEVRRLQAQVAEAEFVTRELQKTIDRFGSCSDSIAKLESERGRECQRAQRLWDLVRYCRHKLFEENLISNEEFAELVKDHPAVARLESYDELRQRVDKAEAALFFHQPPPLIAHSDSASKESECQQAEKAEADNLTLRRLLWSAHSAGMGYGDDGELQDCTKIPIIDFKRDSVDVILAKIMARSRQAATEEPVAGDDTKRLDWCEEMAAAHPELQKHGLVPMTRAEIDAAMAEGTDAR